MELITLISQTTDYQTKISLHSWRGSIAPVSLIFILKWNSKYDF